MSTKSPWGNNIGNWAAEAEREEAEEREAAAKSAAAQPPASFPSLKDSITNTPKQKKKTKMTLQEFTMNQQSTYSAPSASRGLTPEEMLRLPTGPKERSPDEMQFGRLGGGFSNYGGRSGSGGGGFTQGRPQQDYEGGGRRSYAFDDDNRRAPRVSDSDQPSRADGVDDWAPMKRQQQVVADNSFGPARTGPKYGSLGGGGGGSSVGSRADDVDNWASVKKPVSQPPPSQGRSSSFGSGFARPDSDRWTRNEPVRAAAVVPDALKFEPEVKVNKPNPFGTARPREEVLAEKGLDWKKLDLNAGGGGSRPNSSHSSRPGSAQSSRSEAVVAPVAAEAVAKPRPKVNPFGDAKPKEVLLEEKGLDWKKIDSELEHRRVERLETEEEKNLKEEIGNLKKELLEKSGEDKIGIEELIHKLEQELELLVRELDDKVRYSQKTYERPGSGSGRTVERPPSRPGSFDGSRPGFQNRPPSRPGSYEDSRLGHNDRPRSGPGLYEEPRVGYPERPRSRPGAYEDPRPNYNDRPRSRPGAYEESRGGFPYRSSPMPGGYQDQRAADYGERTRSHGTGNSWTRPGDDRRGIQGGGGGRGFFGSRDTDRSGSRW